jgi:hypothetical protein
MVRFLVLGIAALSSLVSPGTAAAPSVLGPAQSSNLELAAPIDRWDEAIPLGNGLTGGLLWGGGNSIRLSLDRGDLWDLRTPATLLRFRLRRAETPPVFHRAHAGRFTGLPEIHQPNRDAGRRSRLGPSFVPSRLLKISQSTPSLVLNPGRVVSRQTCSGVSVSTPAWGGFPCCRAWP